jgi:hypothetical protein
MEPGVPQHILDAIQGTPRGRLPTAMETSP